MSDHANGKAYWRSLEDLADSPEVRAFAEREFSGRASEWASPTTRRHFLKVMGASMALAGMTACRWPEEEIVPFAGRPEGYDPGLPKHYATSLEIGGVATGVLVKSVDGRPIKVDGNPSHPSSQGSSDALVQASILDLYDPDRSTRVVELDRGEPRSRTWDDFETFTRVAFGTLRSARGKGLRVLAEPSSSVTRARLRESLLETFPEARWHEWAPFSQDHEREGLALLYGRPCRVVLRLDAAEKIVCLDADPLGSHPAAIRNARDFAASRHPQSGKMCRLTCVESGFGLTGGMADHRHAVPASRIPAIAGRLVAEILRGAGLELPGWARDLGTVVEKLRSAPVSAPFVESIARDVLAGPRERVVLVAGPRQPAEVHALVELANALLGSEGRRLAADPAGDRPSHLQSIRRLADDIEAGEVETLVLLGGNPAFDAPADLDFEKRLGQVATTIHLGLHRDETGRLCSWHLPQAHWLEAWGDAVSWDGTPGVVQPLIAPLYGGRSPIELLALLAGDEVRKGHDLVRRAVAETYGEPFATDDKRWRIVLHEGLIDVDRKPFSPAPAPAAGWAERISALSVPPATKGLEATFERDPRIHDGRFANNGWLQEMPDPLTKLTWDQAALISPLTAEGVGVGTGDVVRIVSGGRAIDIPVFVLPGQAPGTVALRAGHGRRKAGRVGDGVGVDVYPLRATNALDGVTGVRLEKTGSRASLATTQDHHLVDVAAAWGKKSLEPRLYREATLEEYRETPDFAQHAVHHPPLESLWKTHEYDGYRWAMAIDLNVCTGCGACSVACQSENNIPVVGKDEILVGRGMQWIRIERSFSGDPESPTVAQQPVACQHCEHAPCEQVCPVAATVHSDEGLNDMVYNRCVGTRYCSNNCPYKVRRFNWFLNHEDATDIQKMVFNPEVTVRSRGVMEKCTYCVPRIQAAKIVAKKEDRSVRDGEVVPACAQACPVQAITFGDLNDESSRVRKDHEDPRAYGMLEELNVRPRTAYLAKLRNPAPGAPTSERSR